MKRVVAIFDSRRDAEQAVDWLRSQQAPAESISVLSPKEPQDTTPSPAPAETAEAQEEVPAPDIAVGAGTGMAAGAAVGALFGLVAIGVAGFGPFVTAGALAGAAFGGATGALASLLQKWGLENAEAEYYGGEVERGGTMVAVDLNGTGLKSDEVEAAFKRFNGRSRSDVHATT